jgi:deoxyribodipyrimidine photo-lyase
MKKTFKRSLVWFSNNLRTQSNQLIQEAINLSESILFVFIVDERQELKNDWGLSKMGPFRKKHQIDALLDLKQQLQLKGIQIHIYKGNPTILIPEICKRNEIETASNLVS